MNVGQFNIPLKTQIQKTYSVGKYAKTLHEKNSDDKNSTVSPKSRKGVIITISKEAKEFFSKAQQVKFQHLSPVGKKTSSFKSVFEKVNNDFEFVKFERKSKSKQAKERKQQKNYAYEFEHYLTPEKVGFVVSGNIFQTENTEDKKSPAEKLLDIFELEQQKEPGGLVNVLV